ncbi:MAG TPA: ATP-binding cassette domain-containing protein [Pseudolabrys sp.]|jgi:tungstate transport system ATP-binding protein|nr:ATP-binding cassette domain-containing protein [Pseudolabrys sp.]
MRAATSDLPLTLVEAGIVAGDVTILDRITLTITAGPPTILIGPNGSGKTTLLRAAMGLVSLSSGRITWGDRDAEAPAKTAITFQRPIMLRRTVAANLRYALAAANFPRAKREERTTELLTLVGLDGLDDRPARRLSGGEQQRLALARALARNPAVLFLDEPTASLDPYTTKAIEDLVRLVSARSVKVVMSTHDIGEAKRLAGDIVLLHRGRLIENTPAKEFFANPQTEEARKFIAGELLV